jgi:hypothetical protein
MFLKKIIKYSMFLTFCLFSPILYILIKLIRPFKIVRIIPLMSERYGHFVKIMLIYFTLVDWVYVIKKY